MLAFRNWVNERKIANIATILSGKEGHKFVVFQSITGQQWGIVLCKYDFTWRCWFLQVPLFRIDFHSIYNPKSPKKLIFSQLAGALLKIVPY